MSKGIWKDGTLAAMNIHSLSGKEKLSIEDIGADTEKASKEIVKLGTKELFEKEMLKKLRKAEVRARMTLYLYSTGFPIGGVRFIPNKALPALMEIFEQAKKDHGAAVEALLKSFNTFKKEMLKKYPDQLSSEDYDRTYQLLKDGRCEIQLNTFTLDMSDKEAERNLLGDFVESAVRDLRDTVGAAARRIAANLAEGKPANEKSLNALRRLVERSRDANFVNDPVITESLKILEKELGERTADMMRESDVEAQTFRRSLELVVEKCEKESLNGAVKKYMRRVVEV